MTKELKRFEKWWDAEDDIPNDGPYTPDTPIQFAWAGWQAALAQPEQKPVTWAVYEADGTHHNKPCQYPKCSYPCPDLPDCRDAQPEQEPVAIALNTGTKQGVKWLKNVEHGESLYTAPPQPEQEPVACMVENDDYGVMVWPIEHINEAGTYCEENEFPILLYTSPPQSTWVGLESEEIRKAKHHIVDGAYHYSFKQGAEWAKAKLKERNQ